MSRLDSVAITMSAVMCLALSAWSAEKPEPPAGDAPKSSEAVTVNGLKTVVTPEKATYEAAKVMKFTVTIKNTTENELTVGSMPKWSDWLIVATNAKKEAFRYSPAIRNHLVPMMKLDAGKTLTCTLTLTGWWKPMTADGGNAQGQPLPAGKYNLVITIDHSLNKDPMWIGKIVTSPVEFTVLGAEAGATSAPAPKASEPVTVQGLEVTVTPAKAMFDTDETPTFNVTLKNTTENEVQVGDLPLWEAWHVVATDAASAADKAFRYAPAGMRKVLIRASIAAGKTLTIPATFDLFVPDVAEKNPGKKLAPSTYDLVITIDRSSQKAPQWTGKIVAKPAQFRVAAAKATASTGQADTGGPWIVLSKNEKWYQDRQGDEQVFTGTLEANPDASKPSIRMRSSPYKLGDSRVYSKKNLTLDGLIGKKVELRGKLVNMFGHEIWPAEIREAK